MNGIFTTTLILLLLVKSTIIDGLQVIPERANVSYINKKYLDYGLFYIKRYGRKSAYYLNIEGKLKHTWENNVTSHLIFYEFLHNEYRRSFVEMHLKFCDFIKEQYIGRLFNDHGVTCPALPGEYLLRNITVPMHSFPHVWPFEKSRVDIEFATTDTNETILKAYLYALFKDVKRKNGKG